MNGYRSTLGGGDGVGAGDFTITMIKDNKKSYAPGNCAGALAGREIDDLVIVGSRVNNCSNMLDNSIYNQDVHIRKMVDDCSNMLRNALQFGANIYFHARENAINVTSMLNLTNNSLRKNIYFQPSMNQYFNKTDYTSLVGAPISWTTQFNVFYNSEYNIYCYKNFVD